jgi:hypothetical protein
MPAGHWHAHSSTLDDLQTRRKGLSRQNAQTIRPGMSKHTSYLAGATADTFTGFSNNKPVHSLNLLQLCLMNQANDFKLRVIDPVAPDQAATRHSN